jgi:hypothetical protein
MFGQEHGGAISHESSDDFPDFLTGGFGVILPWHNSRKRPVDCQIFVTAGSTSTMAA